MSIKPTKNVTNIDIDRVKIEKNNTKKLNKQDIFLFFQKK